MEVFVRDGTIERQKMAKEIAKPAALSQMQDIVAGELNKSTDNWWKTRFDWAEAQKKAKIFKENLEKVSPETLSPAEKNMMWRRAKQLKDEFVDGMLSHEEMHPVKGFQENGAMKWVADESRMNALRSVERNIQWLKRNEGKVREFKNIMRHLCPNDPMAGDIEKFRPKMRGIR